MTVSATLVGVLLKGVAASRPAANAVAGGTIYSATDTGAITQSDGSSWSAYATITSGLADPMTTRGDIIVRNASNVTSRLAIGSTGKVLKSDGTDISWQTPSGGGISQSFLGYNTIGGTFTALTARRHYLKKITLASAAELISIDAHIRGNTDNFVNIAAVLLTDTAGAPDILLAWGGTLAAAGPVYLSNNGSMPTAGRWLVTAIGAHLAAGDYWIGIVGGSTLGPRIDIANDGSGSDVYYTVNGDFVSGAYPSAFALTTGTVKYSIRASILS